MVKIKLLVRIKNINSLNKNFISHKKEKKNSFK